MSSTVLANVTGVAIGGRVLLVEGPPGSGKSSLALALIDRGATLVGDDAVTIDCRDGVAYALPPPNITGLVEVRGVGLVAVPTTAGPIALMLTLDTPAARLPVDIGTRAIDGIDIPVLPFTPGDPVQALRAEYALALHGLTFPAELPKARDACDG